jgi:hypothetical protein
VHFSFAQRNPLLPFRKRELAVLAMDLFCSRAVKIPVDFHERGALATIAMLQPLTRRPNLVHSWHVISGTENFFWLFSFIYFFQD